MRSFLRMAGISQKVTPEEVLPLLGHNVASMGYPEYKARPGKPTEYLKLLMRYLDQARELRVLAGPQGVLHFSNCEEAKPLLAILGYQVRDSCGANAAVQTAYAERAFLTVDSGFPLVDVESALRDGKPFSYAFPATPVPVLFKQDDWITVAAAQNGANGRKDALDALMANPTLGRLYWALSRMDRATANSLQQSIGLQKLLPYAAVLDFYGGQIDIRNGRVQVPGGTAAEASWKDLVGASPDAPSDFVARLLAKDDGWVVAYFDALSRVGRAQQAYVTAPAHLNRFYLALRGQNLTPSPAGHAFRPDPGTVLLFTRLQLDPSGQPHVPGNLDVWKDVIADGRKSDIKIEDDWARRAKGLDSPEQLMEAMVGLSRVNSRNGPLQMYLLLSEIDRDRPADRRLTPQTVRLLTNKFPRFSNQYLIFTEFRGLNNASIAAFMAAAENLDRMPDRSLRADALGIFQAEVGLWQIFARQGQIDPATLNDSWQAVVAPFAKTATSVQLFDSGRAALRGLMRSAGAAPGVVSQDQLVALLSGPTQTSADGQQMRRQIATQIRAVLEDQRLVSLDTVFNLADGLNLMSQGQPATPILLDQAAELQEFEMPRPLFTSHERTEWSAGLYNVRHTTNEMKTNLGKLIETPPAPLADLALARGQLVPFMRDTLVALNYAYYEPPGSLMLHHDPLFIRSHDFSGQMTPDLMQSWQTPIVFGRGGTASGGAHLAGSLADLPYMLAEVEQNFIAPDSVQGLIWEDFVPGLLIGSTLPRWWGVTTNELHAVALYQRTGEELLATAAANPAVRQNVIAILSDRMLPQPLESIETALNAGRAADAVSQALPSETFYLAAEYRRRFAGSQNAWGAAGAELDSLSRTAPAEVGVERISNDFGVPHPAMAQSYTRELLELKPFPTFMGYSSRLMAESWESNNLYWARLADEQHDSPVILNRLVPELTHRMVENLLATHPEDWRAVALAMRQTGDEFRSGKLASLSKSDGAPPL